MTTPRYEPLPPREAIAALRRRGETLAPSFDWQDVWKDAHASMFTVAKSAGFDILSDVYEAVAAALAEGSTFRDFEGRLEPVLRAKGWWGKQAVTDPATGDAVEAQLGSTRRLRTIFDTNLRVSYAQGAWAAFEREKSFRPWLRYVALMDGRARPAHAARHNVCLPIDDPFWERWAPPCGWGCRCTVQSLSDRDIARLQREGEPLAFSAPADHETTWTNTRTGEVEKATAGIDPGWDYNPGKAALSAAQAVTRMLDAPQGWTTAALESVPRATRVEAYRRWIDVVVAGGRPSIGHMPVGRLQLKAAEAVGAEGDATWIVAPQGLASHAMRSVKRDLNRDPDVETLRSLPELIEAPIAILRARQTGELIYLVGREAGQWTRVVVRPDYRLSSKSDEWRGRATRAAVVTVDRIAIETYPNSGEYDVVVGTL